MREKFEKKPKWNAFEKAFQRKKGKINKNEIEWKSKLRELYLNFEKIPQRLCIRFIWGLIHLQVIRI